MKATNEQSTETHRLGDDTKPIQMSEPEDVLSRAEKSKSFRRLMFGGKVGAAFSGISGGLLVAVGAISMAISFAGSPNADYVLPNMLILVSIAGLVLHFWRSPILSAPFIMFAFLAATAVCFVLAFYFFLSAAIGEAIIQGGVLDVALREHAIQFKNLNTETEILAHIEKNKVFAHKQNDHLCNVGNWYIGAVTVMLLTAIYGFFSRLWQMENAIIDTQQRLILLCERCLTLAHNASVSIETTTFCIDASEKDKFKDVALEADKCEMAIRNMKSELQDLPAVGYRKGRLLFYKKKSPQ